MRAVALLRATATANWVAQSIANGRPIWLTTQGNSMWPTLRHGDHLLLAATRGALAPGMVVVLLRGGQLVVHRVVRATPGLVITRGDALSTNDPLCPEDQVLGIVTHYRRQGAVRQVDHRHRYWHPLLRWSHLQGLLYIFSSRLDLNRPQRGLTHGEHSEEEHRERLAAD
jgi:signal peptidase I